MGVLTRIRKKIDEKQKQKDDKPLDRKLTKTSNKLDYKSSSVSSDPSNDNQVEYSHSYPQYPPYDYKHCRYPAPSQHQHHMYQSQYHPSMHAQHSFTTSYHYPSYHYPNSTALAAPAAHNAYQSPVPPMNYQHEYPPYHKDSYRPPVVHPPHNMEPAVPVRAPKPGLSSDIPSGSMSYLNSSVVLSGGPEGFTGTYSEPPEAPVHSPAIVKVPPCPQEYLDGPKSTVREESITGYDKNEPYEVRKEKWAIEQKHIEAELKKMASLQTEAQHDLPPGSMFGPPRVVSSDSEEEPQDIGTVRMETLAGGNTLMGSVPQDYGSDSF